jgi:hypothetical protein
VLIALDTHQALDAIARCPPEQAAFKEAAAQGPKVAPCKRRARAAIKCRKAQAQIDMHNLPALPTKRVEEHSQRLPKSAK